MDSFGFGRDAGHTGCIRRCERSEKIEVHSSVHQATFRASGNIHSAVSLRIRLDRPAPHPKAEGASLSSGRIRMHGNSIFPATNWMPPMTVETRFSRKDRRGSLLPIGRKSFVRRRELSRHLQLLNIDAFLRVAPSKFRVSFRTRVEAPGNREGRRRRASRKKETTLAGILFSRVPRQREEMKKSARRWSDFRISCGCKSHDRLEWGENNDRQAKATTR